MTGTRVLRIRVTLAVLLFCFFCSHANAQRQNQVESNLRVTLLQLNDVYQILPVDRGRNAGLARVATLRRQIIADTTFAAGQLSKRDVISILPFENPVVKVEVIGARRSRTGSAKWWRNPRAAVSRRFRAFSSNSTGESQSDRAW
jgi:2',3'-cyclic-nucleotide 2'-phosphodiesterase (5'-nucleotidase family)